MKLAPVPGWRATVTDLGLRSSEGPEPTRLVQDPFIGNMGDKAYFLGRSSAPTGDQYWLAGLDVTNGQRLFTPVPLNVGEFPPACFLNGPQAVLCVARDRQASTAFVIDVPAGRLAYSGPSDLNPFYGDLKVVQVGQYAVAETQDQGVYGIGPRAETTWFVPGAGNVSTVYGRNDFAPPILATQTGGGRGSDSMLVFRVSDGHEITLEIPEGTSQGWAAVFPGGFAVGLLRDFDDAGVLFFDDEGHRTGRSDIKGRLSPGAVDVPTVKSESDLLAFGPDGAVLATMPGGSETSVMLLGARLWLQAGNDSSERYDLTTGDRLSNCAATNTDYVGNDGTIGVFADGTHDIGLQISGRDLTTCEQLWSTTSPPGAYRQLWRINTTLAQLSDDATELVSLVAPIK